MSHATEWSAVVNTTTRVYLRELANLTLRERIVFAMLNRRKRIKYGCNGTENRWPVKFALPETEAYEGGALDFAPSDKYRQLWVDWRGIFSTDTMDEKEYLMNRGDAALIKRYSKIAPDLHEAMQERLDYEMYTDGATHTTRLHGLETFLSDDGATVVADRLARPDSTYGGLSCTPGTFGNWTADETVPPNATLATDWPGGSGDSEYDYMAPRLGNWASDSWGTGSNAWVDNCERCLRKMTSWTKLTGGKSGKIDLWLLNEDLLTDYGNKQAAKHHIAVTSNQEMIELGFPEGYMQEGVPLRTEFGVPAQTGYGINADKMQLMCLYDELFATKGPEEDIRNVCWLWRIGFFGNWRFISPKFFCKIYPYAAA